ncbi:hypothetical protein Q666_12030 [Marinobacter sp. ES-1]|nr:hypothetical protein Q666_12030 [Marinobacter sp. ES-1]
MILAFGHFVSLLTKQTHNIVLSNIFIKKHMVILIFLISI